ncbi:Galactose-binding-like domain superfamily [Sesbania bispinosa]|nr:Galactose-binding-like domain superfamily [Sesbania bispinosa]
MLLLSSLGHGPMEKKKDTMLGKGSLKAHELLEQKEITFDASDYLWYMTSVDINDTSIWSNATLRVKTMGHTLHAYVNRSATVGLANYGVGFDKIKTGLAGGFVQLIGKNGVTMDLSTNLWSCKVGLNGERKRLYDLQPLIGVSWNTNSSYPIGRPMTWYKADFQAPSGTNPVVVDLQGLGKGHAWVNGHSIGRYWPSRVTSTNGCSDTCDYRGKYVKEKCNTNCVTTGIICANVYEGAQLELSCQGGQVISQIQFANFGNHKAVVVLSRKALGSY